MFLERILPPRSTSDFISRVSVPSPHSTRPSQRCSATLLPALRRIRIASLYESAMISSRAVVPGKARTAAVRVRMKPQASFVTVLSSRCALAVMPPLCEQPEQAEERLDCIITVGWGEPRKLRFSRFPPLSYIRPYGLTHGFSSV